MLLMEIKRMQIMKRKKSGQFVIISAVIIATFTLSVVLSIHQISINNQQMSYQPVEELVLGITSDLERCLSYALSVATHEFNTSQDITIAKAVGNQFITKWGNSIVGAYSNIGLRIYLRESITGPFGVYWFFDWNGEYGISQVYTHFNLDIDAYGFKGWECSSSKFVSLEIDPASVRRIEGGTSLVFKITEGKQFTDERPVQNLTPEYITLTLNKSGIISNPEVVSISYMGQGVYSLTFNDYFAWEDELIVRITTPNDNIIVGACLGLEKPSDWSHLFLSQESQGEPVLIPNKITGKEGKIQSNFTQSGHVTMSAESPKTPFGIYLADVVNVTLYLEVSQNQSPITVIVTLTFVYNETEYLIGKNSTSYLGSGPYPFSIDSNLGNYPYGPKYVPANSTIVLFVEAVFEHQPYGRLFLNYGPDVPSNVELF